MHYRKKALWLKVTICGGGSEREAESCSGVGRRRLRGSSDEGNLVQGKETGLMLGSTSSDDEDDVGDKEVDRTIGDEMRFNRNSISNSSE